MRPAAGAGAGDDFSNLIAVQIADRETDAAAKVRVVGHPFANQILVVRAEHFDVRASVSSRSCHDPAVPVAADVADRDIHAAAEGWVVGHETLLDAAGRVENFDVRPAAEARAGDDHVEAVESSRSDAGAAAKGGVIGKEVRDHGAGLPVERLDVRAAAQSGTGHQVRDRIAILQVGQGDILRRRERRGRRP